jgi:hypothetical protein
LADDIGTVVLKSLMELFFRFHNASLEMKVDKVYLCIDKAKAVLKEAALINFVIVSSAYVYS